ncbi:MAG: YkgJ family cysteine cluster protein [Gammaproteobacteria bacterium]|nr:YkgJ family cysteine cluster protein [Gammaproteobacteria bacterium]
MATVPSAQQINETLDRENRGPWPTGSVARLVRERVKLQKACQAYSNGAEIPMEQMTSHPPCNGCTACCRGLNVDLHPRESGAGLDYETLADGTRRLRRNPDDSCVHLVDGRCAVYPIRPQTCRVFDCRDNALTSCVTLAQERPLTEAILRWRPELKTYEDREIFARLHGQVRELHRRQPALHALELAARVVKDDVKTDFLKDAADVGLLLWT